MKEKKICSRCNKEIIEVDEENKICKRYQDVVEFGYPSFPPYRLKEEKVLVKA